MRPSKIDISKLVPTKNLRGDDEEDTVLLNEMLREAKAFVSNFRWSRSIVESFVSEVAIGGVVAVFLLRIEPASPEVDAQLWVIVGDLPPAYLVTDQAPNGEAALRLYIGEMRRWVDAVKNHLELENVIPVEARPTAENADALEKRLDYIEYHILDDD